MALTPEELRIVKAEPLLSTTGVGYMKSEGVEVIKKVKAGVARSQSKLKVGRVE